MITIHDFPLRGKFVYVHIKRRRWTDKLLQEIIQLDWNILVDIPEQTVHPIPV